MVNKTIQLGIVQVDETKLADLCREYHFRELSVFGSVARGDMRPDDDIDLLVEFLPNADVGLIEHAGLRLDLERLLGKKVDLVSKNGLRPRIPLFCPRRRATGLCGVTTCTSTT